MASTAITKMLRRFLTWGCMGIYLLIRYKKIPTTTRVIIMVNSGIGLIV